MTDCNCGPVGHVGGCPHYVAPRIPQPVTADPVHPAPGVPIFTTGGDYGHVHVHDPLHEALAAALDEWDGDALVTNAHVESLMPVLTKHTGRVVKSLEDEVEMWKGLLWDILSAEPEPGLPKAILHRPPNSDTGTLRMYYTSVELSETQTEMLAELIEEHT